MQQCPRNQLGRRQRQCERTQVDDCNVRRLRLGELVGECTYGGRFVQLLQRDGGDVEGEYVCEGDIVDLPVIGTEEALPDVVSSFVEDVASRRRFTDLSNAGKANILLPCRPRNYHLCTYEEENC